jgi:hypothetical protein
VKKEKKQHHGHHHRRRKHHRPELFVFFFSAKISGRGVSFRMITQIFNNDPLGAFVTIAETLPDASGNPQPVASSGPFAITVDDPNKLVNVTAGSADNTTPTRIVGNGSGVGSVDVTVTDQSNTAVGKATLQIVAPTPPPPPVPTLTVGFEPGT